VIIRSINLKTRQYNGQTKKHNRTKNYLQNTTQKSRNRRIDNLMTERKGQKDKQLSTKQFNEKKLNWVQTIDLNLLTCGSDDLTYVENF
jgi:hypothetical protein